MLNNVPAAVSYCTRLVVLRHPNSMDCTVWRKRLLRVELDAQGAPSEMGATPTLGGMGVLRSEDETEFVYEELGPGRMLYVGQHTQADMIERDNALLPENMKEALVECLADPGTAGHFIVDSGDMVFMDVGMAMFMPFEAVSVVGNINIPPYTRKIVLNPRDDLFEIMYPD